MSYSECMYEMDKNFNSVEADETSAGTLTLFGKKDEYNVIAYFQEGYCTRYVAAYAGASYKDLKGMLLSSGYVYVGVNTFYRGKARVKILWDKEISQYILLIDWI